MVGFLPYTFNYFCPVLIKYGEGIVLNHLNIWGTNLNAVHVKKPMKLS